MTTSSYSVYILRCADGSYYTGIAADLTRRMQEHESSPRGAKYLRGRGPFELVFSARVDDRSIASRYEYRIKKLRREDKQALIDGDLSLQSILEDQVSAAG